MTKTVAVIIVVLLLASFALTILSFKPAEAQLAAQQPVSGPLPAGAIVNFTTETKTFLSFRPNPIGVGQLLLVNFWINPALASNNRFCPDAFVITLTKPDGTKDTFTMDTEPATGAQWMEYSPDQAGEWSVKVDFLGTYFPEGRYYNGYIVTNTSGTVYTSAYYRPSSTEEQSLTVQQDMVWSWPPSPLPTDYWTRPVAVEHREWWPMLGNWPGTGYQGGGSVWNSLYPENNPYWSATNNPGYGFTPWVVGPNSAHIVWKRQGAVAGLIGGPAGQYSTKSNPGNPSVVYSGRAYQTYAKQGVGNVAACYDLRTGEVYYEKPIAAGGVTPTLIAYVKPSPTSGATGTWSVELLTISGGRLMKVNPWTGDLTGNYSIAPLTGNGGLFMNQINGYVVTVQDLGAAAGAQRYRLINWTTSGSSATLAGRIISNTTYAMSSIPNKIDWGSDMGVYKEDTAMTSPLRARWGSNFTIYRVSTGEILHNIVTEHPDTHYTQGSTDVADHGKYAMITQQGYFLCWDMATGKLLWKSEVMDYPWGASSFGAYNTESAYGMIIWPTYDGIYAFDWDTGKIVWNYKAPSRASFESPYITNGTELYPFQTTSVIADGKVYVWNTEHSESYPLTRGWSIYCLNVTSGELLWRAMWPAAIGAIADGYLTAADSRDGYMYVFGKGKSETTVTAPDTVIPKGNGIVIKGTVLDLSPAQPGTPCVSKDSMATQMEYLHKAMPIDGLWGNETITGVPVTLTAIGPDGSVIDIGTVTTNGYYGTFNKAWTPPAEGTYEIIATFASDDSYGSSAASTAVTVGPAPTEITIPEQIAPPDYTMTIVYAAIAIIAAVAIIGLLIFLGLRKR